MPADSARLGAMLSDPRVKPIPLRRTSYLKSATPIASPRGSPEKVVRRVQRAHDRVSDLLQAPRRNPNMGKIQKTRQTCVRAVDTAHAHEELMRAEVHPLILDGIVEAQPGSADEGQLREVVVAEETSAHARCSHGAALALEAEALLRGLSNQFHSHLARTQVAPAPTRAALKRPQTVPLPGSRQGTVWQPPPMAPRVPMYHVWQTPVQDMLNAQVVMDPYLGLLKP